MQDQSEKKIQKTQTLTIKQYLSIIFVVTFILITFITAFLQVFLEKDNKAVINARNAHITVKKERNRLRNNLYRIVDNYQRGQISDNLFISQIKKAQLYQSLEDDSAELYNILIKEKEKQRIFGFRNLKIFFSNLAMPLVTVLLSFTLLFLSYKEEDLFLKRILFFLSFFGSISGLFYLVWIFYPEKDISNRVYFAMFFLVSILSFILIRFYIKYSYSLIQLKSKIFIQKLLYYIIKEIKDKYIKKEDKKEYVQDYLKEIKELS